METISGSEGYDRKLIGKTLRRCLSLYAKIRRKRIRTLFFDASDGKTSQSTEPAAAQAWLPYSIALNAIE
jgi:hypothetical protein